MMKFLKQRWVIAALAIVATALVVFVVLPKLKKAKLGAPDQTTPPSTTPSTQPAPSQRLVGAVQYN